MSEDKTTERPWRIDKFNNIIGPQGQEIYFDVTGVNPIEDRANAALIVRAVNMHDRLVEALKRLTALHASWCDRVRLGKGDCNCGVDEYKALIAEAEGLEIPEEGE